MSKLLLLKNEEDLNRARIDAVRKVLESKDSLKYASELVTILYEYFGQIEVQEDDLFAYQNLVRCLMESSFWIELITQDESEPF